MAEAFEDYLERTEKYLRRLEKNEEVGSFIKKMTCFYQATELMYPHELNRFMEKQKIKEILDKISKSVNKKMESVKGIEMDYPGQRVMFQGKSVGMVSAKKFVLEFMKMNEQSAGHYLVVSLMSDQGVFELIQIYNFLQES